MDLYEIIKELKENRSKVFITEDDDAIYRIKINNNGEIVWEDCEEGFLERSGILKLTRFFLNAKYKEFKQPVTWQEALEAWSNHKTVYCIFNGVRKDYIAPCNFKELHRDDIKYGTWYIQ